MVSVEFVEEFVERRRILAWLGPHHPTPLVIHGRTSYQQSSAAAQVAEVRLAVNVLNRMLELGAARSEPIHN